MKKTLLLFALLAFSVAGYTQTLMEDGRCAPHENKQSSITEVRDEIGDFSFVDSDGVEHNLYDELDAGNTVLIDLFFTT